MNLIKGLVFLTLLASGTCVVDLAEEVFEFLTNTLSVLESLICSSVTINDIKFYVYNRENRDTPLPLTTNLTKPSKFLLHGWTQTADHPWLENIKQAYLTAGDFDIIVVDWSKYGNETYPIAVCLSPKVGKAIAQLIHNLGIDVTKMHIVGTSMGAQIGGYIGKEISILKNGVKISRITSLDAAGPLYTIKPPSKRLTSTDASFVDNVHTDCVTFGYQKSIGHADFWVNCCLVQPSCAQMPANITLEYVQNNLTNVFCSHQHSVKYFTESINNNCFLATNCMNADDCHLDGACQSNNTAYMGEYCSPQSSGNYYLTTNPGPPYAKGPCQS